MISLLAKYFIENHDQYELKEVRHGYGNLTSIVGIVNNIILCIFKYIAGSLSNSVSIKGDAINNLTDAASSLISLISFKLSSKPADEKHPFGHARYECIASLLVACIVLFLGFELGKGSIEKIMHPTTMTFSWVSLIVLVVSIGVKLWMYAYNRHYGKLVNSSVMQATATDSISDALSTSAVLISMILSKAIGINLDGYMGAIVAILIIIAGSGIIKSALDELLGQAPSEELVKEIEEKIMSYEGILGIHDLIIHDYGAHNTFVSVHAEVDSDEDVLKSHDIIDNIERDFRHDLGIELVIHMDPIMVHDPLTNEMRETVYRMLKNIHEDLTMHDFRVVLGTTHTNLIFDVAVPYHLPITNQEILKILNEELYEEHMHYYLVINFDRVYTNIPTHENEA